MLFEKEIKTEIHKAIQQLFNVEVEDSKIVLQQTRKDFDGDSTLVTFSLTTVSKKSPEETGKLIGDWLLQNSAIFNSFNQVKGFLNLVIKDKLFLEKMEDGFRSTGRKLEVGISNHSIENPILVEYSSPNTNKPLHLGHIRNNLLGIAVTNILKAAGHKVLMVNIVNDRGIHICKSMLAWMKFGNSETPQSSGMKGDHLVGKYYVEFDKEYKKQIADLMSQGLAKEDAEKKAPIIIEAQQLLQKWESGDAQTIDLWKTMNSWVYEGFAVTYKNLGVSFDKMYYESQTYLLGKAIVEEGLQKNVFYKKEDGSVWIDLTSEGLDQKLVLRKDGTSVYITQDIGTAKQRFEEFQFSKLIYVVGNEQDYHFKVLRAILKKFGYPWWDNLYHMSYNMVDLPSGKMKSREGTVVDADDIIEQTIRDAETMTRELGKLENFDDDHAHKLYETVGLGALKFFMLKVDPEKRMLFNPAESIDINGFTGPFVQYTYARTQSVIRKANSINVFANVTDAKIKVESINHKEKELAKHILTYPLIVQEAAAKLSPALVANYAYELAKTYNQFYHDCVVIDEQHIEQSLLRIQLTKATGETIKTAFGLLGIDVPERM